MILAFAVRRSFLKLRLEYISILIINNPRATLQVLLKLAFVNIAVSVTNFTVAISEIVQIITVAGCPVCQMQCTLSLAQASLEFSDENVAAWVAELPVSIVQII